MGNLTFDWQIGEYMVYCRSRQLREKTMNSYEQALRLFERWCVEQMKIQTLCWKCNRSKGAKLMSLD